MRQKNMGLGVNQKKWKNQENLIQKSNSAPKRKIWWDASHNFDSPIILSILKKT